MAKAVFVPAAFNFVEGFAVEWLRRFYVLRTFNFVEGFAVLASLLEWLKSFFVPAAFDGLMGYARLNGSNHFKQHQTTSNNFASYLSSVEPKAQKRVGN